MDMDTSIQEEKVLKACIILIEGLSMKTEACITLAYVAPIYT